MYKRESCRKQKYIKTILLILLCLLCLSCSKELKINSENNYSKRTLLFYIAGDNNLKNEVEYKYKALLKGWKPEYGDLLLFADKQGDSPVLIRFKRIDGKNQGDTIKRYTLHNSASSTLLKEVVEDMKRIAPANSYGGVFFSHGTGWLPESAFKDILKYEKQTRSMFLDKTQEMEVRDFAQAIPDNTFEFMIFDMCFMANIEALYEFKDKAKYVIASATEILSPGFIPLYSTMLSKLYKTNPDLEGFAKSFFQIFNKQKGQYQSATISLINMTMLDSLLEIIKEIKLKPVSYNKLQTIQHYDRENSPNLFFDFEEYALLQASEEQRIQLQKALAKCIIYKANTNKLINLTIAYHCGLSIYIEQEQLPKLNAKHKQTLWERNLSKD